MTTPRIRDRIKELRRVPASDLQAHPRNWRVHPEYQRRAMADLLGEIGYADALIAREADDGTLILIDGHLRSEVTPDETVPVLVLDVTEAEADKLLVTLDPLAAMALRDEDALKGLLDEIQTDSGAVQEMLDGLRAGLDIPLPGFAPVSVEDQSELDRKNAITCPECGHEFIN